MKQTKKVVSAMLAGLMVASCGASALSVSAANTKTAKTGASALSKYYSTNSKGIGAKKTISVDGSISDWDSSMLIAQGAANDDPRVYRDNSMYEVPIDEYALYGCWDDNNLYLMWEMTNVQDVVAPSDDYPLSQGILYETMNVPFFIAVDTGKSDKIGNKCQLQTSGTIWNSGITFEENVNRIIAISTNGANGPFVYSGDSSGLNAKEVYNSTTSGITFKYGKGILSSAVNGIDGGYGVNNGRKVGDVCSDSAKWVDFNSKGHNSSKLDFHYEMAIPLKDLGVTSSDVANTGLGVMVVATMGKSGMDSLPYDIAVNDNADQPDTESQENNSFEKSDPDNFTVPFARIGNGDVVVTPPSQGTDLDVDPTGEPIISATSNIFPQNECEAFEGDTITVKYDLKSAENIVNGQWTLTYNTEYLSLDPDKNSDLMPNVVGEVTNQVNENTIKGAFSNLDAFDFKTSKSFVEVTFDVLKDINSKAVVDLNVKELSVKDGSSYKNVVKNSSIIDNSLECETNFDTYSATNEITVNAKSNLSGITPNSITVDKNAGTVTVDYELKSTMKLVNIDWALNYDSSKLRVSSVNTESSVMPNIEGAYVNLAYTSSQIRGNASNLEFYDFTTKKSLVQVTFDIVGKGTTNVNLDVSALSVGYKDSTGKTVYTAAVKNGTEIDLSSKTGFTKSSITGSANVSSAGTKIADVNGDGRINIMDATAIQMHLANKTLLSDAGYSVADANGDGKVDVNDVTTIQKYIAKAGKLAG